MIHGDEGAGRMRLLNGRRMEYRAFREAMAEQFPKANATPSQLDDPDFDELANDVRSLKTRLGDLEKRVAPALMLKRAIQDKASGRLESETKSVIVKDESWS
jgi:hypothetical protein